MTNEIQTFRFCEVESIDDPTDCNRIKVRLQPEDGNVPLEKLPYAIPLLPQIFHVKPKVHEAVLIITAIANNGYSQRYYIGPVISQINHLPYEPIEDVEKEQLGSDRKLDAAITMDVDKTSGTLPKDEDIAVNGRKYSDIILTDDDLRIRCGVKNINTVDERDFSFNGTTSSYIKLKYYPEGLDGVDRCHSTATIIADKINLIGNNSSYGAYKPTTTPDELISDEEMTKMINTAHNLPYGDLLVNFLILFRRAFLNHTHPFPMLPPCSVNVYKAVKNYDLNKILSDSVRIS